MGIEPTAPLSSPKTVVGFRVDLFLFVPCFHLMSHGKNQHDIVGRHPAIFGDVTELAPREYQFPAPILRLAAQQRMIRK